MIYTDGSWSFKTKTRRLKIKTFQSKMSTFTQTLQICSALYSNTENKTVVTELWVFFYWPYGCNETLDGVRDDARVTSQNGPGGRVFGVNNQWACSSEQVGGAVQHGATWMEDGLLSSSALNNKKDKYKKIKNTHFWWINIIYLVFIQ